MPRITKAELSNIIADQDKMINDLRDQLEATRLGCESSKKNEKLFKSKLEQERAKVKDREEKLIDVQKAINAYRALLYPKVQFVKKEYETYYLPQDNVEEYEDDPILKIMYHIFQLTGFKNNAM